MLFRQQGHVAIDRNPGPGYNTLLLRMIPGDILSACPHRQFYTLPGLLDNRAALPNSNPNALRVMLGGSLYHFYDGLWYDPTLWLQIMYTFKHLISAIPTRLRFSDFFELWSFCRGDISIPFYNRERPRHGRPLITCDLSWSKHKPLTAAQSFNDFTSGMAICNHFTRKPTFDHPST